MDFQLNDIQEMVKSTAREFAENECRPGVAERDEKGIFPEEQVRKLSELGFMGMIVAEEHNGAGFDTLSYVLALEEIARVDPSTEIICSVNNSLVCYPLETFGSDYIKETFLAPLASGEKLGAFCLSEPGSGSDAGAMKTKAVLEDDHWIINGSKNWITNGDNADYYVLVCVTDPEAGKKGTSTFVVPTNAPGLIKGKHENKMGIRATDTISISLENVVIPDKNLVGKHGDGFKTMLTALDSGRLGVAAQGLGIAQAALEEAQRYSSEREQFGRTLDRFQAIQFKLADMQMKVHSARLVLHHAAWKKDQGKRITKEAAIAKVLCSEAAMFCADEAIQIHGGYGYTKEYPVERMLRDAKITQIYEGTNEIQRLVIARS